ncbi:glycosyltransferase [Geodermatophilus poikilotrophus]|uniref:Glycosyltransferase, catalytic subunit of cellulose synthase and poly-beta-1,6-N-acetylglucosamine synthase n=1 Tax=Geodermatophilus poikilotrophus TaxID=1333667 RepID=A0A1I0BKV6_9ACTN|nr:glycosyltransferase family 2 protein [Geodermatophilus poikilotrophus]SET07579.1 Glycosyltransferase, catalytic subunit of cellulose synthase and poly-beta-1,6-N-acetylglucosamine synthase [Geodermatophilus poikilotrophus]
MRVVALIPAHNEEETIDIAIDSLRSQSRPPDRIVVVADNCTDRTVEYAVAKGVEVFPTTGNTHKKGGALNQALARELPGLDDEDGVFVMDADSSLDDGFFESAIALLSRPRPGRHAADQGTRTAHAGRYGGIGGTFRGRDGGGFVGWLQRNEYARYARDVRRRGGRVLVLTGTATLFRVRALRDVHEARLDGRLPGVGYVYDTQVLTEDNELTFALLHLGYRIRSPKHCTLTTEVMPTWGDLYRQRLRWKRGALENCLQYGLTRHTFEYWFRQLWTGLGVVVIVAYLLSIVWALAVEGGVVLHPLWLAITVLFAVERVVTVRSRGALAMVVASVVFVEMTFDLFLQGVHGKAVLDSVTQRERAW